VLGRALCYLDCGNDPISCAFALSPRMRCLLPLRVLTNNGEPTCSRLSLSDFTGSVLPRRLIEFGPTKQLFARPADERTDAYSQYGSDERPPLRHPPFPRDLPSLGKLLPCLAMPDAWPAARLACYPLTSTSPPGYRRRSSV